jgi:hypothetical protein
LFSQPNPNDPAQTRLYYEKKFSDIFSGFLNTSSSADTGDLMGSSSADDLDILGSSASTSSLTSTNMQLAQLNSSQSTFLGTQNLDLMNQAAAIIGKNAMYIQDGVRHTGLVQSVVNDNGIIAFRVDGINVPMQSIQEITEGSNA